VAVFAEKGCSIAAEWKMFTLARGVAMRKATVDPVSDEQPMTASQGQFNLVALSRVFY
jgi:hypothetical protein